MPGDPNKLSQFWQELKRRKVLRVITVYAAAAFVILQLVEILAPSLRLPEWTMNLILVLLIVGFIIAVILSWIYDVHPEGGIVKTEPSHKVKEEDIPKLSNSWKIASYFSFVVIVGLIVLNIIPRTGSSKEKVILDKSIAVLPFINDSQDKDNEHLINGIMEDLLINLQSIKELRVPGRTSVEQYRNNLKPIPEIASELNVAYIVEGSGQRYGNKIRLRVQLVEGATDKHLWADSYDEEINEPEDIFRIQSRIAKSIAAELQAVITPEEKQLIEKVPTTDVTAHDFYQRGREEYWKYWSDNDNRDALKKAEDFYYKALEFDSTYAQAYSGLAWVYWDKNYWNEFFSKSFLDSALILANRALSFDDQLSEVYTLRGRYYTATGKREEAVKEFDNAIKYNPNDWMAYYYKGSLYSNDDYVKYFANLQKAASLHRGSQFPEILERICWAYINSGFIKQGKYYAHEVLKLTNDSAEYYLVLSVVEKYYNKNTQRALDYSEKAMLIDSLSSEVYHSMAWCYLHLDRYEEMLEYFLKYIKRMEAEGRLVLEETCRIGLAYWLNGYKEEAEYYFNLALEYNNNQNQLGRFHSIQLYTYYDLASIYAFHGEKDKAYENLRIFNKRNIMPLWVVWLINRDPLFDSIKDEPEFQQIVRDVESKHQAEHERVRKWLEENDML
jgi:TolB-like protein/Tfp pilus assembly protein PilF